MSTPKDHTPKLPVTVLVPTRNESGNVAELVRRLPRIEHLVFIDDSDDDTPRVIEEQAPSAPFELTLVHRGRSERHGGLAGAVQAGLELVDTPWVCVMDGDLQHPPEVVTQLLDQAADTKADLVIASRRNWDSINHGLGPVRRVVSWAFGKMAVIAFGRQLAGRTDPLSGFFLVRSEKLDPERLDATGFKILLEVLLTHPELAVAEVGFNFDRRLSGRSNGSVTEGLRYLRHLFRLWRRRRRATLTARTRRSRPESREQTSPSSSPRSKGDQAHSDASPARAQ